LILQGIAAAWVHSATLNEVFFTLASVALHPALLHMQTLVLPERGRFDLLKISAISRAI
jgi:hypothetical protein